MKKLNILLVLVASIITLQCFASAATANPFHVKSQKETDLYVNAPGQMAYMQMEDSAALFKAINSLPILPRAATSSSDKATVSFMTVKPLANYERHKYALKPTELVYDNTSYKLTKEQYDNLKSILDGYNSTLTYRGAMIPQWLVTMNPGRVKNVVCKIDGKKVKQAPDLDFSEIPFNMRCVLVEANYYEKYTGSMVGKFTNAVEFRLDSDSGIHYNIIAEGDKLYVEASNKSFGCQYTLVFAEAMIDTMKNEWIHNTPDNNTPEIISNDNGTPEPDYGDADTILDESRLAYVRLIP